MLLRTSCPSRRAQKEWHAQASLERANRLAERRSQILGEPQRLLAAGVASTVDVVTHHAMPNPPGEELARAVGLGQYAVERGLCAGDGSAQRAEEPGQPVGDIQRTLLRAFEDVVVGAALALDLRGQAVEALLRVVSPCQE